MRTHAQQVSKQAGLCTHAQQVSKQAGLCAHAAAPALRLQGTLYPMCGMNLAFDREAIGPAMYFGLMGDGQPIGRYDDMWAGWCSKVRARVRACPALTVCVCVCVRPLPFSFLSLPCLRP